MGSQGWGIRFKRVRIVLIPVIISESMNKARYYVLDGADMDVRGNLVSPSEYILSHSKYHLSLVTARKTAVDTHAWWVQHIYLSIDGGKTARWIGLITHEPEKSRKDMFTILVYTSPKGTWYLNKDGTLGKRFTRKVLYKSYI